MRVKREEPADAPYRRLQAHLDAQAVGFPATRNGTEIRLLKHVFSPFEAEVALGLTFRPQPLEVIWERVKERCGSIDILERTLLGIEKKGGIESRIHKGRRCFALVPLVVGIYEMQIGRLTPAFIADFKAYTRDLRFGIELVGTRLPQMRTIPVQKSIRPEHRARTFDEVSRIIADAAPPFVILPCICRTKKAMEGGSCKVTARRETCLALGGMAQSALRMGIGRSIGRDEALGIIETNQKEGLVLQPANTQRVEFICSCCGCCCGMLGIQQMLPRPLEFWVSNFQAGVDTTLCRGCGRCVRRCQVKAVRMQENARVPVVDLYRCIGCGVCVVDCPTGAMTLFKKKPEIQPPVDRDALYEAIRSGRMGPLEKARLVGKVTLEAVASVSSLKKAGK